MARYEITIKDNEQGTTNTMYVDNLNIYQSRTVYKGYKDSFCPVGGDMAVDPITHITIVGTSFDETANKALENLRNTYKYVEQF